MLDDLRLDLIFFTFKMKRYRNDLFTLRPVIDLVYRCMVVLGL